MADCLIYNVERILGVIKMQRRDFMALLTGAALGGPRAAFAQSSSKVYRLGTLTAAAPINEKTPTGATLSRVLEQRGYTLGKTFRSTHGQRWAK
jgi:hypothetical protein